MSSTEITAVVGLISAVITIFETSGNLYDAATHAKGLHEAFRVVSINIQLVLEILVKCKESVGVPVLITARLFWPSVCQQVCQS